ncbi:MAG: carboxylesterase family protein, partial [Planctomycetota bacterium]|nr:carboxylesterase family protein [Planctomycetota bacterium]
MSQTREKNMSPTRFWKTFVLFCNLVFVMQLTNIHFVMGQELTPQIKAQLLKRFPQLDKDGDGKLSVEEIDPIREQVLKALNRQKTKKPAAPSKPKGPAPTYANLKYGDHKNTVMDVWLADSKQPTPVIVAIHGGGFTGGDKSKFHGCSELLKCMEKGVSFVSINYRFRNQDSRGIRACLYDSARAIQFVRHHAKDWNIDKSKVAAYGGSAGAGTSLWLACHEDLADPNSTDPIQRESTRLVAAGLNGTQATYDVLQWPDFIPSKIEWTPELVKTRERELMQAYGLDSMDDLETTAGEKIQKELDMLAWMTKDDPPIWMKN